MSSGPTFINALDSLFNKYSNMSDLEMIQAGVAGVKKNQLTNINGLSCVITKHLKMKWTLNDSLSIKNYILNYLEQTTNDCSSNIIIVRALLMLLSHLHSSYLSKAFTLFLSLPNNSYALNNVGFCYQYGYGVDINVVKA